MNSLATVKKSLLYTLSITFFMLLAYSCGGDEDDPIPTPEPKPTPTTETVSIIYITNNLDEIWSGYKNGVATIRATPNQDTREVKLSKTVTVNKSAIDKTTANKSATFDLDSVTAYDGDYLTYKEKNVTLSDTPKTVDVTEIKLLYSHTIEWLGNSDDSMWVGWKDGKAYSEQSSSGDGVTSARIIYKFLNGEITTTLDSLKGTLEGYKDIIAKELTVANYLLYKGGNSYGEYQFIRDTNNGEEDDDGDGVINAQDVCPNTPKEQLVDSQGCTIDDGDNDGYTDSEDACLGTPFGASVDEHGCEEGMYVATTYIPDDNFEQALIDLGYDDILDNNVLTRELYWRVTLEIENKEISDLTGIEDFTNLRTLRANNNALTFVDLSKNIWLTQCYLHINNITELVGMENLDRLTILYINRNKVKELDLSQMKWLNTVHANYNELTELNLENNPDLLSVSVGENMIETLNLSGLPNLSHVDVKGSDSLTQLNLRNGHNSEVINLWANDCPKLNCIQVDDAAYSEANWRDLIDQQVSFSEDCEY